MVANQIIRLSQYTKVLVPGKATTITGNPEVIDAPFSSLEYHKALPLVKHCAERADHQIADVSQMAVAKQIEVGVLCPYPLTRTPCPPRERVSVLGQNGIEHTVTECEREYLMIVSLSPAPDH